MYCLLVLGTTIALQNLTESVNEAAVERNKTTVLQTQLTSNMKRLQDKLQQAKARIAKVHVRLELTLCSHNNHEMTNLINSIY